MIDDFSVMNAIVTILSIIAGAAGFVIKRIFSKIDDTSAKTEKLEEDVAALKVRMVENHPNKNDFDTFKRDITNMLVQIITPINSKLESIETYLRTSTLKRRDD